LRTKIYRLKSRDWDAHKKNGKKKNKRWKGKGEETEAAVRDFGASRF